jgi:hypothetical protein
VNDIDQENEETSVHQANYTFTHVRINKLLYTITYSATVLANKTPDDVGEELH